MTGDVEPTLAFGGSGAGLVTREESAASIIESLVTEAEEAINSLARHS